MSTAAGFLDGYVRRLSRMRADAVERACEAALLTGVMGVMVTEGKVVQEAEFALSYTFEARPDPSVPFGFIHYTQTGPAGATVYN